ncbi:MAG: hypothetical protein E7Z62_01480 [Thermoplasmata archaeon]|nr:hypothetical protein [Thermoplasmata archaeon]
MITKSMRLFMFAALAILMASACVMISENSEEADAISNHGTSSSPLDSLSANGAQFNTDSNNSYYVKVGGTVSITLGSSGNYSYYPNTVTSGYGLSKGSGSVSGTISKAGTISVGLVRENSNGNVSTVKTITIYAVNASSSSYTEQSYSWNVGDSINKVLGPGDDFTGSIPGVTLSSFINAGVPFVKAVGSPTTAGTYVITTDYDYKFTVTVTGSAATQYTCYLYYNANGGSGVPSTQSYSGTSTSNHSFTVSSTTPTRSGYDFLGWSTSSSATSASYQGGSSISVSYNGSKTLYAVWQEKVTTYTITVYKGNWESFHVLGVDTDVVTASSKSYTVESGTRFDVDWYGAQDETGSGTNYTYTVSYDSGCYNMASSLYGTSLGDSVTVTKTAKYYPAEEMGSTTTYSYQYTIKYNANGGSGAPSNTTATASTTSKSITLSSTVPTRSGYTFLGWSTSSSATSASYQAGTAYSFSYGSTQLYAVWKQSTITVSGTPDTYGVVGSAWSFKPTVSVSGCSVSISGASWLSANGTNVSGTPTSPGTYNVTLTFSKSGYTSATKTFSITVLSALNFESSPTGGAIIYAV